VHAQAGGHDNPAWAFNCTCSVSGRVHAAPLCRRRLSGRRPLCYERPARTGESTGCLCRTQGMPLMTTSVCLATVYGF
jgi:hypothetical protein